MKLVSSKAVLIFLWIVGLSFYSCKKSNELHPVKVVGQAFGTAFHITYYDADQRDLTKQVDSFFYLINKSLSTYIPTSDISKINKGDTSIFVDTYFKEVFQKSKKVYNETDGIFDPTIDVLVNAWGFGPQTPLVRPDSLKIKELLTLVGFDKVQLTNGKIIKTNNSIYLGFNAIAKGYAVDVVARFLESKNIMNYLVEIGGEIRARGDNQTRQAPWKMGIEEPNFDGSRSLKKIIELKDEAIATSGNYRKFKIDSISGKKYAHILNTKTGYPSQNSLLSVSVIAKLDCADVDAYATALMAMPLDDAKQFLAKHQELKGFLIYSNNDGNVETFTTSNF